MSESCNQNCSSCEENCDERKPGQSPDFIEQHHPLSHIKKVVGVMSGKGGVGKSMVTSLLAVTMQRRGFRVGILDADITGPSIPRAFGITGKAKGDDTAIYPEKSKTGIDIMSINLLLPNDSDPVVWRGPVIAGAVKQFWTDVVWSDIDYLFVDLPPGTGDVPLTVFQSLPLDAVVMVATPQDLVSMVVEKALKMANLMHVPVVGLVENMSYFECPGCGQRHAPFGEGHLEETAKRYGLPVLGKLPINPKLAAACDAGTIELFDGSWLDAAADVLETTKEEKQ